MEEFKVVDIVQSDCGYYGEIIKIDGTYNAIFSIQVDRPLDGDSDTLMIKRSDSNLGQFKSKEVVNKFPW
ncbi:MAG: hypothetical protein ABIN91_11025 [Mucilaginibacter sp.]|uniref:hypothetical protein n=1 Tax=Mucilaginibacter sp. TaxID=1882438 RepID=UPI0032671289